MVGLQNIASRSGSIRSDKALQLKGRTAVQTSAKLSLPYIAAAQAQKHVTHNEALRMLDAIVQLSVGGNGTIAPPAAPQDGERHIVGSGATGAWVGRDGQIAQFIDGAWQFFEPQTGWMCWDESASELLIRDGGQWTVMSGGGTPTSMPMLGINTTADAINRLSTTSPATLLSAEVDDHRLNINKASPGDTAAVLFQTGFSGRAEFGTTGDDNWHVKVSADGSNWSEVLVADAATGRTGIGTDTPGGRLDVAGAIHCEMEPNTYGFTSNYTALVMGALDGANGGNGGLFAIGRNDKSFEPFVSLCGWDSGNSRVLYFGGGGWGVPDATHQSFYTASEYDETPNGGILRLTIDPSGATLPGSDNAYTLGSATRRWSEIHAVNGTIQTSDERDKTDLETCDLGLSFVRSLRPVRFRWKTARNIPRASAQGIEETAEPGTRAHYGLSAQDVRRAALKHGRPDFAGWVLSQQDDANSRQGLRYSEFIAPLIQAIQELAERVEDLERGAPQLREIKSDINRM